MPEATLLATELRQLLYGRRGGTYRILSRVYDELDLPTVRVGTIRHGARLHLTPDEFDSIT